MDDIDVSRNIKLVISYDGTEFCGFQTQSNGRTVQAVLESALHSVLQEGISVGASGRTDSGVHAIGQVVSFRTTSRIGLVSLTRALNSLLPCDVRVGCSEEVDDGFHARFSARAKCYEYRVWTGSVADVFLRRYAWCILAEVDECRVVEAASRLVGVHDFSGFQAAGSPRASAVRHVTHIECDRHGDMLTIRVGANGFLYKMVRNIVGCLVEVGRGRITPDDLSKILESRDRSKAPPTAPAHGLFLLSVEY